MRKQIKQRKFGRKKDQRKALLRGLASDLILRERVQTTLAKAKEIKPEVEKLVTRAAKDDLATARYLASRLSKKAAQKARKELGPKFAGRPGGYLRIIKTDQKRKDGAAKALIEFVKQPPIQQEAQQPQAVVKK
ncbi:MAG: 50S ribosomal protein L17 [Candidatus Portnoybacteria bacterium CG10_big_fil_rev_8_21_14_0_10_44_7]|uniref:50S ribosomal protein L17 n=1 Tax=Candidatus Portnoybacteria bacterium CG10_big_fil_rev_8_21_14_0_10_44_7 TaxID=1974816 RepID=A0A2M8KJB4_9BACT|nr:MAG: 50S ribosomal protein L17 [Candidatus Portnoybacteria bacterium CG10_big_fil_rev_8_21_14_0_10_44_7]